MTLEYEPAIETRYEIYAALEDQRSIITTEGAGRQIKAKAWERVDFLLDCLIEVNAIEVDLSMEGF